MFPILLIAAAVALVYSERLKVLLAAARAKATKLETHHWLAAGLVVLAGYVAYTEHVLSPVPEPEPAPVPIVTLDLRGKFLGETAAQDAMAVCSLCDALALDLEWDGTQAEPMIRTGVAFDELRIRARKFLLKGESVGDRQPLAREEIEQYLNDRAGTSGGPLTPESRSRWVAAYRDVARAAEAAYR